MNKPIRVELTAAKILRSVAPILLVLAAQFQFGNVSGQTFTNLCSFSQSSGGFAQAGLVQGSDGNFYGTTFYGGTSTNCENGCGTIFRVSPTGSLTNLHSFEGSDGKNPAAALIQGTDGNFYGTTTDGGNTNLYENIGVGTVFRISPSGTFTSLYTFTASPVWHDQGTNGVGPGAGLVQGSDGNFYGTTGLGGQSLNCSMGCGTIFRIDPNGCFTSLHSFDGADGQAIHAGLVQGCDGNFYGTTSLGGTNGCGTIFRISSNGSFTNFYMFSISEGGPGSDSDLVLGSDGNFYGTTAGGGAGGYGSVFRISPDGSLTNLYSFHLYGDGAYPSAVVQASDGNFYGTTYFGGLKILNDFGGLGYGTLFRVSPSGTWTNLYTFSRTDTAYLRAKLIQGSDGDFYGTSWYLGANNMGTVFRFSIPLSAPPFPINQISQVQRTGNDIIFSIPSVAGETYQLQFTPDLTSGNWSNVPSVVVTNSIGALLTLTNFGGALGPQGFYRFAITP